MCSFCSLYRITISKYILTLSLKSDKCDRFYVEFYNDISTHSCFITAQNVNVQYIICLIAFMANQQNKLLNKYFG